MKKSVWGLALALLSVFLLAACDSGGPTGPQFQTKGVVRGKVLSDAGRAVSGAEVVVDGNATGVETDGNGYFEVSVGPGEHLITVVAEGMSSRPYAVEGSGEEEIVIEMGTGGGPDDGGGNPGDKPPVSDKEFCKLYPRECEEPPKDEPPKEEPPLSDEEFCKLYPWECEEPPKDEPPKEEPPLSDEEFCKLYPWECEEPPKDEPPKEEPPLSDEEFCKLYPWECEKPPAEEPI
jgi:hypothetical protein